jgi:hypothetical protein
VLSDDASGSGANGQSSIEVTLTVLEAMEEPGYIGIGWGKQEMKDAHIWFCQIDEASFSPAAFSDDCGNIDAATTKKDGSNVFSCCLAIGTVHRFPQCATPDSPLFYELEVTGKYGCDH